MIRPLQDRVLVKRVEAEETTATGIIIPDTAKEKPQEGEVVAVGPGKRLDNGSVQEMGLKKVIRYCSANMEEQMLKSMARIT